MSADISRASVMRQLGELWTSMVTSRRDDVGSEVVSFYGFGAGSRGEVLGLITWRL